MDKPTFRVRVTYEDDIDKAPHTIEVDVAFDEEEPDTLVFPPWTFSSNSLDHSKPVRISLHEMPE